MIDLLNIQDTDHTTGDDKFQMFTSNPMLSTHRPYYAS